MSVNDNVESLTETKRLRERIRAWAEQYSHVAAISETLEPHDEFGTYSVVTINPLNHAACELQPLFVPGEPPRVGVSLDSWGRLVDGHHLSVAALSQKEADY